MKILWLSHLIPYPPKGGVLQRTHNMIKEVSKHHEITLFTFNQVDFLAASLPDSKDPLTEARNELLKIVKQIIVLDIRENENLFGKYSTALKALLCGKPYNMEWLKSPYANANLKKTLDTTQFDAVHIDTISLCVYFDLLKSLPITLNHHNFESEMLRSRAETEKNFIKSLFFKYEASTLLKSEIYYCSQASLNLTCSKEDALAMKKATGGEFLSVPNGVDMSYFYPNTSTKVVSKNIVIVGGLTWYPNREAVEYFIREVWPLIKTSIPEASVDIVGRTPTQEMLQLAQTDHSFRVHGFVDDVRPYLWRAQFYICPIRTGGGTKLKILDALATGCCIIADPFSCKGIDVQNGVHVKYAQTPKDYVDTMVDILENPYKETALRQTGPELIRQKYSYDSIGELYSTALDNLVAKFNKIKRSST